MNNDSDVENSIRKAEFTVGFLLQPHFSLLAFTAAADALTTANLVIGKPRFSFQTLTLGAPRVVSDLSIMIPCDPPCLVQNPIAATAQRLQTIDTPNAQ